MTTVEERKQRLRERMDAPEDEYPEDQRAQRPALGENVQLTAAAEHTGAMIALIPSVVDAERLVVDGGEPVEELHVTLGYLGEAALIPSEVQRNIVRCVAKCVENQVSIVANAFAVAMFNPDDGSDAVVAAGKEPCVVLLVSGQQLTPFHDYVMDDVEMHPQHSPWVAHLTLAYTADADLSYFTDRVGPVTFDKIRIAFGSTVIDLPLGNAPKLPEER
jgi:2'-5' RNA ligase